MSLVCRYQKAPNFYLKPSYNWVPSLTVISWSDVIPRRVITCSKCSICINKPFIVNKLGTEFPDLLLPPPVNLQCNRVCNVYLNCWWWPQRTFTCFKEYFLLTHSGHGDHEEVDTVPVAQALLVGEVRGVSAVLKLIVNIISVDTIWSGLKNVEWLLPGEWCLQQSARQI